MTDLAKLTWKEVEALLAQGCAAILPVGSTEAHGPHLPLDTDVTISLGMARRAGRRLAAGGRRAVVLPPVSYAVTEFAAGFPGSLGIRPETAVAHLKDVLTGAARTGFRPIAIANGHLEPDHITTIQQAAESVSAETGVSIVFPDVTRRRLAERLTEEFRSGACHAGRYEGSLILADDPRSVKDDVRRALPPVPISLVDVIRSGETDFIKAGGTQAYFGWPAEASAQEGRTTFDVLAAILAEVMLEAWPD